MKERQRKKQSIKAIKANLKRLESVIRGPYMRPADYATRDRLARRLCEAKKLSV